MLCNIHQGIWRWGIYLKCNGLWMLKNMFYVYAAVKRWPKQTMNLCVSSLRGAPNYRLILNSVPHTFNNSSRDFIYKSCFFYRDILAITVRWFDTFFLLKFAIWRTTDITSTIKLQSNPTLQAYKYDFSELKEQIYGNKYVSTVFLRLK